MATVNVTDANFSSEVLGADKPVLVDFWAEWCGPCKAIAPALESLSETMGDQLTVAKLNIDDNPETPSNYGVRGIPTLILFQAGEVAATKIGALPAHKLTSWVEESLSG
ncbi:MAG: thioredoxin [Rhodospirillaceae bacterium]|nr:thioredoxin [Rhodospirillaceae bacterium]|tara:strand:+ start:4638 stop:4964 length:327 start_codon:yes stop_codon:yes gene_type:complete